MLFKIKHIIVELIIINYYNALTILVLQKLFYYITKTNVNESQCLCYKLKDTNTI